MSKIDPKDKNIYKNKHHIQTYINMFVIVSYSMALGGGGKGKKNDSQQYQNTLHLCR
jgi:hypothetical protein